MQEMSGERRGNSEDPEASRETLEKEIEKCLKWTRKTEKMCGIKAYVVMVWWVWEP